MKRSIYTIQDARFEGMRIDKYLSDELALCSRSRLKSDLRRLTVNGREVKLSYRIAEGDVIEAELNEPAAPSFGAEEIPLEVLYEDERAIVIEKPQGMVVHPAAGNRSGTLVQGLLYRLERLGSEFGEECERPGIVHRLDRDTSGVIIAAKDPDSLEALSAQFQARETRKVYYAVVKGRPAAKSGTITGNIARDQAHRKRFTVSETRGKPASTGYRVLKIWKGYSFLRLTPETGRTHQLRVHLKAAGCPILGDPVYARKDPAFPDATLMLHAASLTITLPGETRPRTFRSRLPDRFAEVLRRLEAEFRREF